VLYGSADYLRNRFETTGRRSCFSAADVDGWRVWRGQLRSTIKDLVGLDRMERTPLHPRITETVQCEGYRRERVEIDTEPGVVMPLYVLVPDGLRGTVPAILAPHGHLSGGKYATTGRREISQAMSDTIDQHNYDYGVQAVKRGYVVFCPDARGQGERREKSHGHPEQLLEWSCKNLQRMGLPLGRTVAGMWTWDLMVLLDYVATRSEVAGEKVGCIGLSGGGLQTLYLAALDERISCAVISGYFYGVADSLLNMSDNCDCNFVPHLWEHVDMGDIAALIAPRPLLFESARGDPLNGPRGMANVLEQYAVTEKAYTVAGVPDQLTIDIFDGGHMWHGVASFDWLAKWLPSNASG
jgi:dienelactone hydrolase